MPARVHQHYRQLHVSMSQRLHTAREQTRLQRRYVQAVANTKENSGQQKGEGSHPAVKHPACASTRSVDVCYILLRLSEKPQP